MIDIDNLHREEFVTHASAMAAIKSAGMHINGYASAVANVQIYIESAARRAIAEATGKDKKFIARVQSTESSAFSGVMSQINNATMRQQQRDRVADTIQAWADAHARRRVWEETGNVPD